MHVGGVVAAVLPPISGVVLVPLTTDSPQVFLPMHIMIWFKILIEKKSFVLVNIAGECDVLVILLK